MSGTQTHYESLMSVYLFVYCFTFFCFPPLSIAVWRVCISPAASRGRFVQQSASQNNREFELDAWAVSVNLVKYFPKPKNKATKRLLQGLAGESEDDKDGKKNEEQHQEEEEEEEDDNAVQDIVSFWNPNKTCRSEYETRMGSSYPWYSSSHVP